MKANHHKKMSPNTSSLKTRIKIIEIDEVQNAGKDQFALDVLKGLTSKNKSLPSKYFYDETGSELFKKITDLKEYYLTQAEFEILDTFKEIIAGYIRKYSFNFVELGSGDGRKTKILLKHFVNKKLSFEYFPLDISKASLEDLLTNLQTEIKELKATGLSGDYFHGIKKLSLLNEKPNLVLFLGSNIGNFKPGQAFDFMVNLWESLSRGDLILIGFDLVKDESILLNAYKDPYGITSLFNLNLLDRINTELEGDFDVVSFKHYAYYNPVDQVMKSYLLSQKEQVVTIRKLKKRIHFEYMEPIFTESSYKYTFEKIKKLSNETGFKLMEIFQDKNKYFMNVLLKCVK